MLVRRKWEEGGGGGCWEEDVRGKGWDGSELTWESG